MDSYFANLRKSSGAMELVLRNDDAISKSPRPRICKSNMKKPSSCPNYDAPNCPARKASHEDLDGYGSVHTFRTTRNKASKQRQDTLTAFYDEVAPGMSPRKQKMSVRRRRDAENAGWGSPGSSPKNPRLRLRSRAHKDRSMLFQGMVSEVLQCHSDILGPRADARAEQVKKQLAEYIKAVEGLVVEQQQQQDQPEDQQPTSQPPPQAASSAANAEPTLLLTRSASAKKDARWSARPGIMYMHKQHKSESSVIPSEV